MKRIAIFLAVALAAAACTAPAGNSPGTAPAGNWRILVGSSSEDIRSTAEIKVI